MVSAERRPGRVSLGQNFLADPNLLEGIIRDAAVSADDVVLEVGGGEGVLTRRLAEVAAHVHVVELDQRLREGLEAIEEAEGNVQVHMADAMRFDFSSLDPAPVAMVANLPYSVAAPVLLRTVAELPEMKRWTAMVQREIADRLRAAPGSKQYGSPSVMAQLSCKVETLRNVDPAVFKPRPRVGSALIRFERTSPSPGPQVERLVRAAFAHRRKAMARSVAMSGVASRERMLAALEAIGRDASSRAEQLAPEEFRALAEALGESA